MLGVVRSTDWEDAPDLLSPDPLSTASLVCAFHADPEAQLCHDCGIPAWRQPESGRVVHEDFCVRDDLWDAVCPDDGVTERRNDRGTYRKRGFVLCIQCFERRLGRQLTREDFTAPPSRWSGVAPSYRFRRRWKARSGS